MPDGGPSLSRLLCRGGVISRANKALTQTQGPPDEDAHEHLQVTGLHKDLSLTSDALPLSFSPH